MRGIVIFLSIFLVAGSSYAQGAKSWLIYFGQTHFMDNKISVHHELQYRDHKVAGDINQLLFRFGLKYRFNENFLVMGGYGFIYTELEKEVSIDPFRENRIFQQATLSHRLFQQSRVRHRVRLEQRFVEGQDFSNRFRYCLFVDIPLTDKGMGKKGWYMALYDEVFLHLANDAMIQVFDRNRAYIGIGYKVKDSLGIQLGYMRQHIGKNAGIDQGLISVHHQIRWR